MHDDDKIRIAQLQVSPDKCHVVFTTKNMLRLLGYKQPIMCLDSTYRCLWNRWPFHIYGVMDKHHHFHPIGYMFGSNEDADSYTYFLEALRNMHVEIFGYDPEPKYSLNDNADAIFKAFKSIFPDAYQMNCFAHMINRNLHKYACKLSNSKKIHEIKKDLNVMADLAFSEDFERAVELFRTKYSDEREFLDTFEKEYLLHHKGHWSFSYLVPGTPRSNNGLERYNRTFKELVTGMEPMSAYDFLKSLETHVIATSRFCNDIYVHKITYYHTDMEENRKKQIRAMYKKALNENFYFTEVEDVIVVPAKKYRTKDCTEERIKIMYEHYLSTPENEDLKSFLARCFSCWRITQNSDSEFKYDCTCPIYCLYGQCKHVIRFSFDKGIHKLPEGLDFRPLKCAGKRGKPKGSGTSHERYD